MSILEVIGWLGSAILVWSLMQTEILRLRVFNLLGCLIHIGYNAVVGVWPMVGLNIALAIINIYNLVRLRTAPGATSAYEAVEVGPDDGYLRFLLERFRNLHPGTFLFHDSGLLATHGFNRVATPAGALATYYEKIGFTKTAAGYELALSQPA